jgi:hypothetical protein
MSLLHRLLLSVARTRESSTPSSLPDTRICAPAVIGSASMTALASAAAIECFALMVSSYYYRQLLLLWADFVARVADTLLTSDEGRKIFCVAP